MALSRTPSLAELLNHCRERWLTDVRVALPARVERYDRALQLVDVKPLIGEKHEDATGTLVPRSLPVIPNVPLAFPGAGGMHITFPIQVGDTVLVVFSDRSIDAWQDQGGLQNPDDLRRHHLTDAIAIPGLHDNKNPISNVDGSVIEIGANGANSQFVATAPDVSNELSALRNSLNALVGSYNSHTHTGGTISGNTGPAAPPGVAPAAVGNVASATVKIKG